MQDVFKRAFSVNKIRALERDLDAATRALWTNPKLLALVTSIIGPDLAGTPLRNLRSKTPATHAGTKLRGSRTISPNLPRRKYDEIE